MTEDIDTAESGETRIDPNAFRDAEGHLSPHWLERLRAHLAAGEEHDLAELMEPLHAADAGDVLEALDADERVQLVQMLGDKFDYLALTEVDDTVRSELIDDLPVEDVARGMSTLDSDDAVYILEDIDSEDREEILAQMPAFERLSLKRSLDLAVSLVGLVLLSPFLLLTAIIIKLTSPGPVFYTQERMGLDGRPFEMVKFRSMRPDAEVAGPGWTTENDPRVTPIGRFMRRTNWDELPQLVNVLLGEMSLVGPRPERPVYVQQFRSNIPRYMERHREKAGMTGWAQVNGLRGDTSIAERTTYDLWYVENWSLWLDIKIIIRTMVSTVLRRDENAY